jgi:hydrogenase nickel incorporation protein HypB
MTKNIPVLKDITQANTVLADSLRDIFVRHGVLVLDIIASPGAGKSTVIEKTIARLQGELRLVVIEGDPTTSLDAERMIAAGVPAVQINTGGGCHLEAHMIQAAVRELDLTQADVVIVENVGNLMCPVDWDLGEDVKVVVASLPEGDDKPLKYPLSFMAAQAVIINKIDLEPYLPARVSVLRENTRTINPEAKVFEVSAISGEGFDPWLDWIRQQLKAKRAALAERAVQRK